MPTLSEAQKSPGMKEAPSKDMFAFVKDLASYYMDFLETDFHRRKTPKRSVRFRNSDNLLVGINLGRYFDGDIPKALFCTKTGKKPVGGIISVGKGHLVLLPSVNIPDDFTERIEKKLISFAGEL